MKWLATTRFTPPSSSARCSAPPLCARLVSAPPRARPRRPSARCCSRWLPASSSLPSGGGGLGTWCCARARARVAIGAGCFLAARAPAHAAHAELSNPRADERGQPDADAQDGGGRAPRRRAARGGGGVGAGGAALLQRDHGLRAPGRTRSVRAWRDALSRAGACCCRRPRCRRRAARALLGTVLCAAVCTAPRAGCRQSVRALRGVRCLAAAARYGYFFVSSFSYRYRFYTPWLLTEAALCAAASRRRRTSR